MSDTDPGMPEERRRKPRMRWLAPGHLLLGTAIFAGLALFALSLVGSSIPAPGWLVDRVESQLNTELGFGHVELESASLVFDPGRLPHVLLEDVGVFAGEDTEFARLDVVRTKLAPGQLLKGIVALDEIRISGAQITMRRDQDGEFAVSSGTGADAGGSLADTLGGLDEALGSGSLSQLSTIIADSLTITLEDARADWQWQAKHGSLVMERTEDFLDLSVAADVFSGTEEPASARIELRAEPGSSRFDLKATFENATIASIAAQSPALSFLNVVDAPVSGTLTASFGGQDELADFAGSLAVGQGTLRPAPDVSPIRFEGGRLEVAYDPDRQTFGFTRIEIRSEILTAAAEGTAMLQDFRDGRPSAFVGQFALSGISLRPRDLYPAPLRFKAGTADFRVKFAPFRIDIGQMTLQDTDWNVNGAGRVVATETGWDAALDVSLDRLSLERLRTLWPASVAPGIRKRFGSSLTAGMLSDLNGALRISSGQPLKLAATCSFSGVAFMLPGNLPAVSGVAGYMSLHDGSYTMFVEQGVIVPSVGGDISVAGSALNVSDMFAPDDGAKITVLTESTITSLLSLVDQPPLELLSGTELTADLADGRAELRTEITLDPVDGVGPSGPFFEVTGQLLDTVSDTLVKDRRLQAPVLDVRADAGGIKIGGEGYLGQVPVNAVWSQGFGHEDKGKSRIEGTAELSQRFLDEFGIELPPDSVSGAGIANIVVTMTGNGSPEFDLKSDLGGIGMRLGALGWSKPPDRTGTLEVGGQLGERAAVDRLFIDAAGLTATGTVEFAPDLKLKRVRFERVTAGGWFDGQVTLTGRGAGLMPAVAVNGGTIDFRSAQLDLGGAGVGGPMTLALDRLVVSDKVSLTGFAGEFSIGQGFAGSFSALVNGWAPVTGTVSPAPSGAALRFASDRAGKVLEELGLLQNARGGRMEVSLVPAGAKGVYEGRMKATGVQIVDAPVMAELLNAISIVGLLDLLSSGGITMSKIDAAFRLSPRYLVLHPSSAVGPSLGISLEGVHDIENHTLDMQGVISPVYFLNSLGRLFTPRGGEGVFGFTFGLNGDAGNPQVSVNPVSILTPGVFREIFRAPPPSVSR